MIETIEFNGKLYPKFQASGNAARFIIPFATEVCKGIGIDIGCGRGEWAFPGVTNIVDPVITPGWHAMNIPDGPFDYIFSSHCLEHVKESWHKVLDYWFTELRPGGTIFLYLPHPDQEYWLPWNDDKHVHILHPEDLRRYFEAGLYCNIFVSGRDLNYSFIAMAQTL
jgi:SAM-dependent methyltransferase